jgi:tyrosyl-tRNA synthetase
MLTFLALEQINEMDSWKDAQLNTAKKILAFELTKLIHGEEEAESARAKAHAVFAGGITGEVPETEITEAELNESLFLDTVFGLVNDPEKLKEMSVASSFMGVRDATSRFCDLIERVAR